MHNDNVNFEIFREGLLTCDFSNVERAWNLMSEEGKDKMRKEISSLPKSTRRDIHLRLNLINEHLAVEVMGDTPVPVRVYLDGRWFSPQEIRDTCITNIKSVPRFIMAIHALKEVEQRSLLEELKSIDLAFYNSVSASITRLEQHTQATVTKQKSIEASLQESREKPTKKTPVTYLCQYVEDKSELLALYAEKLKEKGLTYDQVTRILEIESQLLGPEDFGHGT